MFHSHMVGSVVKNPGCQCRNHRNRRFNLWVRKIPWRRVWQPTPVFLPGESHRQRDLAGYSPWGHKESDRTSQLSTNSHIWLVASVLGTAGLEHFITAVPLNSKHCSGKF